MACDRWTASCWRRTYWTWTWSRRSICSRCNWARNWTYWAVGWWTWARYWRRRNRRFAGTICSARAWLRTGGIWWAWAWSIRWGACTWTICCWTWGWIWGWTWAWSIFRSTMTIGWSIWAICLSTRTMTARLGVTLDTNTLGNKVGWICEWYVWLVVFYWSDLVWILVNKSL